MLDIIGHIHPVFVINMYVVPTILQDITINPDVEKEIATLKEEHPNIQVTHGGLGGYVKPKPRPEPIDQLHKHLNEHNIKLMDVFRKFDADGTGIVPESDFREAIKVRM